MALIVGSTSAAGGMSFVSSAKIDKLRTTLLHAFDRFDVYRAHFEQSGIKRADLEDAGVLAAFAQLAPINKAIYAQLQDESLRLQSGRAFVVDPSSGTTGVPVLKFTSPADDEAEASVVRAAFARVGVAADIRCACLDIGASQIYLFYMSVMQQLGVRDPVLFKLTSDPERTVHLLRRYDPDLLVSIPSVLKRCIAPLREAFAATGGRLRKIVYIGEPMEEALRRELEEALAVKCYSFYGTTEIGSVCIECSEHSGMHVPLEMAVPTLHSWPHEQPLYEPAPSRYRGIVSWTSLGIRDQPVVKYAVNDLVEIDLRRCGCGDASPRLLFRHRVDEAFFLYGITFTYEFFLDLIESALGQPVQLALRVIHRRGARGAVSDEIVVMLEEVWQRAEEEILEALSSVHPLSELIWSGFLRLTCEFVGQTEFATRKVRRVWQTTMSHEAEESTGVIPWQNGLVPP